MRSRGPFSCTRSGEKIPVVHLVKDSRPRPNHLSWLRGRTWRNPSDTPYPTWSQRSIGVFGYGRSANLAGAIWCRPMAVLTAGHGAVASSWECEMNVSPNDHYDQGPSAGLQCIQESVALTDQEHEDVCFLCWPRSHKHRERSCPRGKRGLSRTLSC